MTAIPERKNLTEVLGSPVGLYKQLSIAGPTVYFGGIIGVNPDTDEMAGPDVRSQVPQLYANIKGALEALDLGIENIVRMTTYLTSADDIKGFYESRAGIYEELFPDRNFPPNTLLVVNRLVHEEIKIEVEVTAYKGD